MKKQITQSIIIIGYLVLYSGYAYAACIQNPNLTNVVVDVPTRTFSLQYDDTGSRDLDTIIVNFKNSQISTYSGKDGQCGNAYLYADYVNGWTPNDNKIAASNIPGISVQVKATGIGSLNTRYGPPDNENSNSWTIINPYWTITIKKTGQVTQAGSLKAGIVGRLTQRNPAPHNSTWNLTSLNIPANAIQIKVLSCSLKNTVPAINMGDWYDTQFKNIGDKSNDIDIPITLSCLQGTNIKASVTATSGVDNASQGQLSLSGTNKATGIAIQLVDRNGNPIPLGSKNIIQNNVPNSDYIFGWKARYIKTTNNITPGSANATATVNIRYE